MRLVVLALSCLAAAGVAPWSAYAHDALERYIQHAAVLSVSSENIDVTLEISFNAQDSLDERKAMDANHDAALSDEEKRAYLKRILADAEDGLCLRVDGQELRLVPLYDPELDLYDSRDLEAHPHLLRVFLFARTPASLKKGSTVSLENRLWKNKPAVLQARIKSSEGVDLVSKQSGSALRIGDGDAQSRVVEWKCTAFRTELASGDRRTRGE